MGTEATNGIHYGESFLKRLAEGFNRAAETDGLFSTDGLDFSGVYTVHVNSPKAVPMGDYNKSADIQTANRYGTPAPAEDTKVTYTMKEDKSFAFTIDKGDNAGQFNQKSAGQQMKVQKEEVIAPYLDTSRLDKWSQNAGIHFELPSDGLTEDNIVKTIFASRTAMRNKHVPDKLTLAVRLTDLDTIMLSKQWVSLDKLGGVALPKGSIGMLGNLAVKGITDGAFPEHVRYMIMHKSSAVAPEKIHEYKVHMDPPGLSGHLVEFRMISDAFVLAHKANGVLAAIDNGYVAKAPTITASSGKWAIASATSGATILYTTDGSDPRYSADAKTYTATIDAAAGQTIKAVAIKEGMYASDVAEKKV